MHRRGPRLLRSCSSRCAAATVSADAVADELGDLPFARPRRRSRWSITTARCAPACPRSCSARARPPSRSRRSSASSRARGRGALATRVDADEGRSGDRARSPAASTSRPRAIVRVGADRRGRAARHDRGGRAPGTSDLPVAEEAALTARARSATAVERLFDVGVAGLHRLLGARAEHRARPTRDRRRRRHGGRAAVGGGGAGRAAGDRGADQRRLRRQLSAASPRCSRCSTRARRASPS